MLNDLKITCIQQGYVCRGPIHAKDGPLPVVYVKLGVCNEIPS